MQKSNVQTAGDEYPEENRYDTHVHPEDLGCPFTLSEFLVFSWVESSLGYLTLLCDKSNNCKIINGHEIPPRGKAEKRDINESSSTTWVVRLKSNNDSLR